MDETKWFRVIDPLSPLYGCDVSGYDADLNNFPARTYLNITAMRRIDVFVGDRPFQLVAPKNFNLGLMILYQQLEPSPLQDDVVELTTDAPYGGFLEEVECHREDGHVLHLVAFEEKYQIALLAPFNPLGVFNGNPGRHIVISKVIDCSPESISSLRTLFEGGTDPDALKVLIEDME